MLQPKDADWLSGYKNKTHICCLKVTYFRPKDSYGLNMRGWKNICPICVMRFRQRRIKKSLVRVTERDFYVGQNGLPMWC